MMRGMPPMRGGPMMMRGGPGGPPHPARSGPMGPGGPRDGGRMMNKGNLNKGTLISISNSIELSCISKRNGYSNIQSYIISYFAFQVE